MSNGDEGNPNRTVFRPSPLQGLRNQQAQPAEGAAPPADPQSQPGAVTQPAAQMSAPLPRARDDDIPRPSTAPRVRNVMMTEAAPLLALAAGIRSGRARMPLPQLHAEASTIITAFDKAVVAAGYPEDQRQRAKYALCATIDDIAQNLPGQSQDSAEWARRSLVVHFFKENIGGDRFWQLVDDMLAHPNQFADLIELYHACLAAGFQGRFRVMPDGNQRLQEVMAKLYGALDHVRNLSTADLSPRWRGQPTPLRKVGFWSILALAAGAALGFLIVVYIILRLILMQTGQPAMTALRAVNPGEPLRLSRVAAPPPAQTSSQLQTIQGFLAPEIAQHLVAVDMDQSSIRVRTTVGQLFSSGSDQLDPERRPLIQRIAAAVETQPGPVAVEGYTDSDQVKTATFPDNFALSKARADMVAGIVKSALSHPERVTSQGFGDARAIATNATPQGKSLNRRVEIVIQRVQ